MLPDLQRLGVQGVDLILLSHPDRDHVGGTGALLKAFPNARIAMSSEFFNNSHLQSELEEWHLTPGDILWLGNSAAIKIGDFTLEAEDPALPANAPDNDGSMFIHLNGDGASAVFSGDADAGTERLMESREDWSSEILKVGHHGSHTATDPSWLAAVHPRYGVISCGLNNEYGHPAPVTVQKLEGAGVQIFRTDMQGDISFDFDPHQGFVPEQSPYVASPPGR